MHVLTMENVLSGFSASPNDYTVTCPHCKQGADKRFVARFSVHSGAEGWQGTTGAGSALYCEFLRCLASCHARAGVPAGLTLCACMRACVPVLSPWVLLKEVQTLLNRQLDWRGTLCDWATHSPTVFWNMVSTAAAAAAACCAPPSACTLAYRSVASLPADRPPQVLHFCRFGLPLAFLLPPSAAELADTLAAARALGMFPPPAMLPALPSRRASVAGAVLQAPPLLSAARSARRLSGPSVVGRWRAQDQAGSKADSR